MSTEPTTGATLGVEIVAGAADDTEVAALVAASLATAAVARASRPAARTSEWVRRARAGAGDGANLPGACSGNWRWSLHP